MKMEFVDQSKSGETASSSTDNKEPPQVDDIEDEGPKSSAENIIPIDKIRNGWLAVSGFVISSANNVKVKAVDTYNSESVQNFKRRTSEVVAPAWEKTCEVVTPAWEKTCEVVAPAWEKTCEVATYAVEKTHENAILAKDAAQPRINAVSLVTWFN